MSKNFKNLKLFGTKCKAYSVIVDKNFSIKELEIFEKRIKDKITRNIKK